MRMLEAPAPSRHALPFRNAAAPRHDRRHGRTRSTDHRRRGCRRDDGRVLRSDHYWCESVSGLQHRGGLPRQRRVTDVPVVGHPLELRIRVPRYRCCHDGCEREITSTTPAAWPAPAPRPPGAVRSSCCDGSSSRRPPCQPWRASSAAVGHREQHRRRGHHPVAAAGRSGAPGRGTGDRRRRTQVVPHSPRRVRRLRHRDHRPHRCRRRDRAGAAARPGPGTLRRGDEELARGPRPGFPRRDRDRGDGRVRRLQECRHIGASTIMARGETGTSVGRVVDPRLVSAESTESTETAESTGPTDEATEPTATDDSNSDAQRGANATTDAPQCGSSNDEDDHDATSPVTPTPTQAPSGG
jgi:hypothetical protein